MPEKLEFRELTGNELEFLIRGWTYFTDATEPFPDEAAAETAWRLCRDRVLACRDLPPEDRASPGAYYLSGTRPWGWWRFEVGEDPPARQGGRLDDMGELDAAERAEAVRLARRQAADMNRKPPPEGPDWDRWLLKAWPMHVRLVDYSVSADGREVVTRLADWIVRRRDEGVEPTAEDLAVDGVTAFALLNCGHEDMRRRGRERWAREL